MFSFGFNSCFNSGPQSSLSILLLLKKPDLSLDELLNDDDILTEIKTNNQNLINFLTKSENFEKLVDMAISEPVCSEDDLDFKKYCKLPYIACETLIADIPAIMTTFSDSYCPDNDEKTLENKDFKYFDKLFSFLDKEQLNYTSAGYFAKIGAVLLEKKPGELLGYLYKKRPEHLEKLVNHISSESIAEFLFKLLTFESSIVGDRFDSACELKMVQVLKLLIQKLDTPDEKEISKNVAYVISNVFGKSKTMHKGSEMLSKLLDNESIEEFFRILKKKDTSSVSAAAVVLGNIFDYYIHTSPPENEENKLLEDYKPESKLKSDLSIALITIENIPTIVSLIAEGNDATALGNFRLKLIDFVNIAMETNNIDINAAISKSHFFKVILELCIKFEWHSILHNQVEKIIVAVIESKFEDLKSALFENAKVFNIIVDAFEDSKIKVPIGNRGKTVRKGYLGQLIRIANKIAQSTDLVVLGYTETDRVWKEYVQTKLTVINEIRTMKLGDKQEPPQNRSSQGADEIKFDKPAGTLGNLKNEQQIEQQNVPATLKKTMPAKRNRTEKNLFGIKCVKKAEVKIPIVEPEPEVIPVANEVVEAKDEPEPTNNQSKQKEAIKTVPGFKSFYSIFNFSPKGLTSIHALLQKRDLTLNELLDDDNLAKETRSANKELVKFLTKEENFKQLINHVILEPSTREQESNFQQCCKFPFISSEVLSSGCSAIANAFLNYNPPDKEKTPLENKKQKFFDQLFSFLNNDELNPTAAGYFSKILISVFEKKPCAFLACMYKKRPELLDKIVKHIYSESLAEFLLKLLTFESTVLDDTLDDTYHTKVIHILKQLSQKVNTPNEIQTTKNAAYVISEVLGKSQSMHKGTEVVSSLLNSASVEGFFRILKTKDTGSVAAAAIVLGNTFDYYIHINTIERSDNEGLNSDLPIVSATLKNMQSIINSIADVQGANLGSFRLKLIDFVSIAMETKNTDINTKIAKCQFFKVIMKLFLNFEWHNILHSQIEQILNFVIEGKSDELKISLFENARILDIILEALDDNKVLTPAGKRGRKIRKGYLGHLVNIANKIIEHEDPVISRFKESNEAWREFVKNKLASINDVNSLNLG